MTRKSKFKKVPISNKIRLRMYRQRKKWRNLIRLREQESIINQKVQSDNAQNENENESNLITKLRDWSNSHRIAKRAITDLLNILISVGIDVPKNYRTLQKTPTNVIINDVSGGKYWYNGLEKCLKQIFNDLDKDIKISLNFNIDGLPLYRSSAITFYPILASIHGISHQHFQNSYILDTQFRKNEYISHKFQSSPK